MKNPNNAQTEQKPPNTLNRRLAKSRIAGMVIMLMGLGIMIHYAAAATSYYNQFEEWTRDIPMSVEIDFSKPGTTNVAFEQTCHVSHGEYIYLDSDQFESGLDDFRDEFEGLEGRVEIVDNDDQVIETAPFDFLTLKKLDNDFLLARIPSFPIGSYRANIHVDNPAARQQGKSQKLTARYFLCGLELFPAYLLGAVSVLAFIVTGVAATFTLPDFFRLGWYQRQPMKTPAESEE